MKTVLKIDEAVATSARVKQPSMVPVWKPSFRFNMTLGEVLKCIESPRGPTL